MRVRVNPSLPQNTAIQDYDTGSFILAVSGNSDSGSIGTVFVSYDITFSVPCPSPVDPANNEFVSEMVTGSSTTTVNNIVSLLTDKTSN